MLGRAVIEPEPIHLPLYGCSIKAGFPSPADDWLEGYLDLNRHFVPSPQLTFSLRVSGDSMINAGIMDGCVICVQRDIAPQHGDIVVAVIDDELTVKRLSLKGEQILLIPENDNYEPIAIRSEDELMIWGVVISCHNSFRGL